MSRLFSLRQSGILTLSNRHGKITVRSWSQDRVKVNIVKRLDAETEIEAKALFPALAVNVRDLKGGLEISTQAGAGLSLAQSLKRRSEQSPGRRAGIDLEVFAPARLPLNIWTVDGAVAVQEWRGDVEIRSQNGDVQIQDSDADVISIVCRNCRADVSGVKANLRLVASDAPLSLRRIEAKTIYVEAREGAVSVEEVSAKTHTYSTTTGPIAFKNVRGSIRFKTSSGAVTGEGLEGAVEGQTFDSAIQLGFRKWFTPDQALIESESGSIELSLPYDVSIDLNVRSGTQPPVVDFNLRRPGQKTKPFLHAQGRVRDGGPELCVRSERGTVKILSASRTPQKKDSL